jgi:hypothetical protein
VIEADRAEIEAGIDGEALVLPAPVHCRITPGALRVRVPRKRPGVPQPAPRLDWRRLRKLAATVGRTAVHHRGRNQRLPTTPRSRSTASRTPPAPRT